MLSLTNDIEANLQTSGSCDRQNEFLRVARCQVPSGAVCDKCVNPNFESLFVVTQVVHSICTQFVIATIT